MIENNTIPQQAQTFLQIDLQQESLALLELCREAGLPQRFVDALREDLAELLQDTFTGLHLPAEDIAALWELPQPPQERKYLRYLLADYYYIYQLNRCEIDTAALDNSYSLQALKALPEDLRGADIGAAWYQWQRYMYEAGNAPEPVPDRAVIERHSFFILRLLLNGYATAEQAAAVLPVGCKQTPLKQLQEQCAEIMHSAMQAADIAALYKYADKARQQTEAKRKRGRPRKYEPVAPATDEAGTLDTGKAQRSGETATDTAGRAPVAILNAEQRREKALQQVFRTQHIMADALSKTIYMADLTEGAPMRPLAQALAEKQRAGLSVPTSALVTQVMRLAAAIERTAAPVSTDKISNYRTYYLTLNDIARACIGTGRPNAIQLQQLWRGLRFLSTQRIQFTQYHVPAKLLKAYNQQQAAKQSAAELPTEAEKQTGETIALKYEPYTIEANILVANFRHPQKDEAYKGTTEVKLLLNDLLFTGRDTANKDKGATKYYIKPMPVHLTTAEQFYSFSKGYEIVFFNILLSKSHAKEPALIEAVFDYKGKIAAKQTTKEQAAVRRQLEQHRSGNAEDIARLFEKARELGIIAWYNRRIAQDGSCCVYDWTRPKDIERYNPAGNIDEQYQ